MGLIVELILMMVVFMIFESLGKRARTNQYGSRYVKVDGFEFDSIREAHRYEQLKKLEQDGKLTHLTVHPKFTLMDGFRDRNGEWQRPITYSPDFTYIEEGGRLVAEDVKSAATVRDDVWMIKKKMFLKYFGNSYDFRVV